MKCECCGRPIGPFHVLREWLGGARGCFCSGRCAHLYEEAHPGLSPQVVTRIYSRRIRIGVEA